MITAPQLAAALRAAADTLDPTMGSVGNLPATATMHPQQAAGMTQAYVPPTQTYTPPPQQPPPGAPANLTADQLVALIQPHIGNDQIKAALGEAMRANGVANLPDAQPHQYPTLYAAFQQVLARFGIGGAPGAAQTQSASII